MGASFSVEFEKLRRRPATWVLGAILIAFIVLLGYVANYAFLAASPMGAQLMQVVLPASMPSTVLSSIPQVGAALAVIMGAMAMGSEYRWDTVKASVVRKPGRLGFVGGKLLALGAAAGALALAALVTGLICSLIIAAIVGQGLQVPPLADAAAALGAAWLILAVYAVLGLFLGTLVKGAGAAIALGLIYILILETFISNIAGQMPGGQSVGSVLPGGAANNLTSAIGQSPGAPPGGSGPLSSPAVAVLLLVAWVLILGAASILLFARRDSP